MLEYMCVKKKIVHHMILLNCKYIQEMTEMILNIYEFVVSTKHYDSIWLE
jgi:hypothetical protein